MASERDLTALPKCNEPEATTHHIIESADATRPSAMSSKRQSLSDLFTIVGPSS